MSVNSTEYLKRVLEHWKSFCIWHPKFKKAIEDLLAENFALKQELFILKADKEK